MHSMINNNYFPVFFEPVVASASEPLVHGLTLLFAARIRHAAERIINQQDVCAAAHQRAADACREIAAALAGRPTAFGLAVLREAGFKNLGIFRRRDQIPNIAPEIFRQGSARAG